MSWSNIRRELGLTKRQKMKKALTISLSLIIAGTILYILLIQIHPHQNIVKIRWANIKKFTGTIESITFRDLTEKTGPEITVVDKNHRRLMSVITKESQILDVNGTLVPFDRLKKDDMILGKYIVTEDGINVVKSIRRLKKQ